MADSDLIKLYSARILELASDIPHLGRLAAADISVTRRSPQCGSTITVDLTIDAGRITGFGQDVKACALGQASAALLGAHVIGRTQAEIEAGRDALGRMLGEDGPPPGAPFVGFEVLTPARDFRNRHASILLAFDATADALAQSAEKAENA